MYAREHGSEPDPSWAIQGAIELALRDDEEWRTLRNTFRFVFIPILDADAATKGVYENLRGVFVDNPTAREAIAFQAYFRSIKPSPKSIVLNLHNPSPRRRSNLACSLLVEEPEFQKIALLVHGKAIAALSPKGYVCESEAWATRSVPNRLSGWLSREFGIGGQFFELHSQAPARHLNLHDLRSMGESLLLCAIDSSNSLSK